MVSWLALGIVASSVRRRGAEQTQHTKVWNGYAMLVDVMRQTCKTRGTQAARTREAVPVLRSHMSTSHVLGDSTRERMEIWRYHIRQGQVYRYSVQSFSYAHNIFYKQLQKKIPYTFIMIIVHLGSVKRDTLVSLISTSYSTYSLPYESMHTTCSSSHIITSITTLDQYYYSTSSQYYYYYYEQSSMHTTSQYSSFLYVLAILVLFIACYCSMHSMDTMRTTQTTLCILHVYTVQV